MLCKRHVPIGTGFKQTDYTIFLHGIKIAPAVKCIFEENVPKLSVNFGNHIS